MKDSLFREYDIRGVVGKELILEEVYTLGLALAAYFIEQDQQVKAVALARDTRFHSLFIEQELERALKDSGLDVVLLGECPTPVLYFSLHTLPVHAGLMVTASHNGLDENGIKICLGKQSLFGRHIQDIKRFYREGRYLKSHTIGIRREYPVVERYVAWMAAQFKHLANSTMPITWDFEHGKGGQVMQLVLEQLNITVPTTAPVKIGFDYDADRLYVSYDGQQIAGDKFIGLFARDILQQLPNAAIVYDYKCSLHLARLIKLWGGHAYSSPTGHSLIRAQMRKQHSIFGGELSGHYFFNDRYFGFDDGLYAALRLYEIIHKTQKDLKELLQFFPSSYYTPEIRVACSDQTRTLVLDSVKEFFAARSDVKVSLQDGVYAQYDHGWVLIRPSHTESVLSLRMESVSSEGFEHIKRDLTHTVIPLVGHLPLSSHAHS